MRAAPPERRAYTYTVTVPPAGLPVLLATAKNYLKVTSGADDALITILIGAATGYAEGFTRRDFITREYETFRDFFSNSVSEGYYTFGENPVLGAALVNDTGNVGFELRRSPLQTVETITYLLNNVLKPVFASTFYNTIETDYSEVLTVDNASWPDDADRRLQSITITFKTGFGDSDTDMPSWVTEGILQHVANMYRNRGDCSACGDTTGALLPLTAKLLYLQNRIENI
ncbi:MAG: head-tail connector protein [Nitrosomonadaceae bacterium]